MLRSSAIADEVIAERGYFTATRKSELVDATVNPASSGLRPFQLEQPPLDPREHAVAWKAAV